MTRPGRLAWSGGNKLLAESEAREGLGEILDFVAETSRLGSYEPGRLASQTLAERVGLWLGAAVGGCLLLVVGALWGATNAAVLPWFVLLQSLGMVIARAELAGRDRANGALVTAAMAGVLPVAAALLLHGALVLGIALLGAAVLRLLSVGELAEHVSNSLLFVWLLYGVWSWGHVLGESVGLERPVGTALVRGNQRALRHLLAPRGAALSRGVGSVLIMALLAEAGSSIVVLLVAQLARALLGAPVPALRAMVAATLHGLVFMWFITAWGFCFVEEVAVRELPAGQSN